MSHRKSLYAVGLLVLVGLISSLLAVNPAAATEPSEPEVPDTAQRCLSFDLDGPRLLGVDEEAAVSKPIPAVIVDGTYDVTLISQDTLHGPDQPTQPNERWILEGLNSDGDVVVTTKASDDIADDDPWNETPVGEHSFNGVVELRARHANIDGGYNSVEPVEAILKNSECSDSDSETSDPVASNVIEMGDRILTGKGDVEDNRSKNYPIDLPDGTYNIELTSIDHTHNDAATAAQPDERWVLQGIDSDGRIVFETSPTDDLPDDKSENTTIITDQQIQAVAAIRAQHSELSDKANSVTAAKVVFAQVKPDSERDKPVDVKPASPTGLIARADQLTTTSVGVRWGETSDAIAGYRTYLNGELVDDIEASSSSYVFEGLEPGTFQRISVTAVNKNGVESNASQVGVITPSENISMVATSSQQVVSVELASCFGDSCQDRDPVEMGCDSDAETVKTVADYKGAKWELRYSKTCNAGWTRINAPKKVAGYGHAVSLNCVPDSFNECVESVESVEIPAGRSWTQMVSGNDGGLRICYGTKKHAKPFVTCGSSYTTPAGAVQAMLKVAVETSKTFKIAATEVQVPEAPVPVYECRTSTLVGAVAKEANAVNRGEVVYWIECETEDENAAQRFWGWVKEKSGYNAVKQIAQVATMITQQIWNLVKGCAGVVGDLLASAKNLVDEAKAFKSDPVQFVQQKIELFKEAGIAIKEKPYSFVQEILADELELDTLENNGVTQWAGKMGCTIAVAVLTGGGKFAAKFADTGKLIEKIRDINRRDSDRKPDKKKDDDNDTPLGCLTRSSFPTGTQVRMGDATLKPIQNIVPGDSVQAADPDTGEWTTQTVLNQWSATHTGEMATATLNDGSTTTATDDHKYWINNRGEWVELESIQQGDTLLTPDGVTVVNSITESPTSQTQVWEIDTTGPDTYTVWTGTSDVLVHNAESEQKPNWVKQDDNYLESLGINPHEEKTAVSLDSKYDIYRDKNTGELAAARKGLPGGKVTTYLSIQINDGKVSYEPAQC